MKVLKEVTQWDTPNHTYFTNDSRDKIYAYIKSGGIQVEQFKKPIKFSVSHRKFKEIDNTFDYSIEETVPELPGKEYRVPGSANNVYVVREHLGDWTCTCPASKWQKGPCKHIKSLQA